MVKAFLLPYAHPESTQTAVTVNMVGQGSNTKILNTADIQSQKINITSLPALKGTDFYYWMSSMDKKLIFLSYLFLEHITLIVMMLVWSVQYCDGSLPKAEY